jgi:hypothetical protein
MKTLRTLLIALMFCAPAFAWDCPSGQIRQQAPAGTSTSAPYYDVVEGIAFICVPTPTATTPSVTNNNTNTNSNTNSSNSNSASNSTANSSSNSASTSSSNQNQKQTQKQTQSQVATGGNATGGSASAQGGAANASAQNNGNGSNNTTTNVAASKIPVASAIAPPALPSAPCIKSYGGSAQTMAFGASFGGGKVDEGCDTRETARSFSGISKVAQCKLLVSTKASKKAGVTMEDCMGPVEVPVASIAPLVVPQVIVAAPVATPASAFTTPERETTTIACSLFDNICKRQLDEMVLRYKGNTGGKLSLVYSSYSESTIVRQIEFYLAKNGVDNIITTLSGRAIEVYITLIN